MMKKTKGIFTCWLQILALVIPLVLISTIDKAQATLPQDYQEFKARYQQEGRTPEGAAKLYFEAVFCYMNETTRAEGSKMLRYALYSNRPIEQSPNFATFRDRLKHTEYHHIFRGFAAGTSPGNSYQMSPDNFSLMVTGKKEESDYLKLFLKNSGADSPRPVWMKEYDGLWYMINNASTYSGIRPPQAAIDRMKNSHDADYDMPQSPAGMK